ncbi:KRAB-A domain-containing protein 2-like [Centruroides vittatus]|uniref:KRAB-A domain-containing protein 2-like n=1 Tax=Centruroides vittatus TaxID=120091 RepID=UPI00350FF4D0
MTTKKEPMDYWLLNRYDVIIVRNKSKFIYPVKEGVSTIQYCITDSLLFHVHHQAQLAIGHGGRDRMLKELSTKYRYFTRHDIKLYSTSTFVNLARKNRKGHLTDFHSQPDREYKFITVYQDHLTKFVILKSLTSKTAEEVAYNLVDIFSLLEAPFILQSDNGREFSNNVVTSLKEFWPALKIVHPRHLQSQSSIERANQDIENMHCTWMQDKKSDHWSEKLRFVQFMKYRAYHSATKRTPYDALFGCKPKVGLTTSFPPEDVLKDINTEEQLESVKTMEKGETNQTVQKEQPVLKNMDEITS